MSVSVEIGRNIRQVRKQRGLTLEWVALEAGISVTWMGRIEKEGENITIDTLMGIAKALGVGMQALVAISFSDEEVIACIRKSPQAAYQGRKIVHIGDSIVQLRKEQGLTQKILAQEAEVSVARLRDVEHGCANATIELLDRIAEGLGVSLLALVVFAVPEDELLRMIHEARSATVRKVAQYGK